MLLCVCVRANVRERESMCACVYRYVCVREVRVVNRIR